MTTPLDVHKDCRAAYENPCSEYSKNHWRCGRHVSVTPSGVPYVWDGMDVVQPSRGLRVPQRRPFYQAEYYNGGCYQPYCQNVATCPDSTPARTPAQENEVLDFLFDSSDPFIKNYVPPGVVGVKGNDYNSTAGWIVSPDTNMQPRWKSEPASSMLSADMARYGLYPDAFVTGAAYGGRYGGTVAAL